MVAAVSKLARVARSLSPEPSIYPEISWQTALLALSVALEPEEQEVIKKIEIIDTTNFFSIIKTPES
jgi:hypothetical protein